MNSQTLLDLATSDKSGLAGAAQYHLHAERGSATRKLTNAQRDFLQAVHDQAASFKPERYRHPETDSRLTARLAKDGPVTLSDSDLAWLSRLPRDPQQISYDDAVHLAGLAREVSAMTNASDARLVDSVWAPVKALHDARRSQVDLRNAEARARQAVPHSAIAALADALIEEVPELHPDEAGVRAASMLKQHTAWRDANRQRVVAQAQATIAALEHDEARRGSSTYLDASAGGGAGDAA